MTFLVKRMEALHNELLEILKTLDKATLEEVSEALNEADYDVYELIRDSYCEGRAAE